MTAAELVGRNIRRLRKARGLKQTTLAEMCGYSAKASGTTSKIERGQIAIDVNVAGRIARALEVELPELFQGEAPATTGASGQEVVPPMRSASWPSGRNSPPTTARPCSAVPTCWQRMRRICDSNCR